MQWLTKNLNWQSHTKLVESKSSKNITVLFKGSLHLNKKYLSVIYFTFIHSYIKMMLILHGPAHPRLNLKIYLLSKNILFEFYFMKKKKLIQILIFMQKVKNTTIPWVFLETFEEIEYKYPTRFSKYNFKQPPAFINYAKFSISFKTTIME